MLIWIVRSIFLVVIFAVMFVSASSDAIAGAKNTANFWAVLIAGFGMGLLVFFTDVLTPKKKLQSLAGIFFGLIVGVLISGALAPIVDLIRDSYNLKTQLMDETVIAIKWMLGVCISYLIITIVMRTKDDVRFVIPYVEFAKQTKGARPLILDTSVIIDGRIADLCQSRLFDAPVIVPRFVLNELQLISDSSDRLKRNRGRRGLDILKRMQETSGIDIEIDDTPVPDIEDVKGVDQKLIVFSKNCDGRLATTDYNLSKVAQVRDVDVVNINDIANSLKTVVLPGEALQVKIIKIGEEADQGIGYLDDGTMIVVEEARDKIGKDIIIAVTSSLQTSAGKMIFGKFDSYAQPKNYSNNRDNKDRERPYYKKTNADNSYTPRS
jgi:uncharacterized protein YacL